MHCRKRNPWKANTVESEILPVVEWCNLRANLPTCPLTRNVERYIYYACHALIVPLSHAFLGAALTWLTGIRHICYPMDAPSYTAIPYYWRSPIRADFMQLNGARLVIAQSLSSCIKDSTPGLCEAPSRYLWINAIRIN